VNGTREYTWWDFCAALYGPKEETLQTQEGNPFLREGEGPSPEPVWDGGKDEAGVSGRDEDKEAFDLQALLAELGRD
jgi:hypothetical protein